MIAQNLLLTCSVSTLQLVHPQGIGRFVSGSLSLFMTLLLWGKCVLKSKQLSYKTGSYILFEGRDPI